MKVYTLIILILTLTGCGYTTDKLIIKNNSDKNVCYETLITNNEGYYQASAGGEVVSKKTNSPTTRGAIWYQMEKESSDKILYVVYYDSIDREYVYKNIKTIVNDGKFKVNKYSLKELDSLKWVIIYDGK
ncbi:MAG: hypothetical protein WCJ62_13260 [Flavobacterium sp.]